ncbi:probable auxin efflux carrier component 1c [Vicia villosa]|uniref:probable auxin efflux carrier component 1c n=1 Tax=Vicia villosa TaxID=3911 RepID=UPI00273B1AB6|nr:probable auxin efflux carrier component 1c [Vicia villosa]
MINGKDVYNIVESVFPLYVAMTLGYASIKWWKIFTPDQCAGVNHFVASFAVPALTFVYIIPINPYHMNWRILIADTLQKIVTLLCLILWNIFTKRGSFDWTITVFSLINLPNTLVVGIPLLQAMYGDSTPLLIQIVFMQGVLWYTVLLIMYEYRAARIFIAQQFVVRNEDGTESVMTESEKIDIGSNVDVELGELLHSLSVRSGSRKNGVFRRSKSTSSANLGIEWKSVKSRSGRVSPHPILKSISGKRNMSSSGRLTHEIEPSEVDNFALFGIKVSTEREHESKEEKMEDIKEEINEEQMPPSQSMVLKLIVIRVYKKLIKNPNLWASVLGIIWALIAARLNIKLPTIIYDSVTIMSKTGLGMSMFSLGIFMALQPKIIACGKKAAAMSMLLKFLIGPALFGATSAAVGVRGVVFKIGIVQVKL